MKNSSYLSWAAAPLLAQLAKPAWPARALARAPARAPALHLHVPAVESYRCVAAMRRRRRHALTVLLAWAHPRSTSLPIFHALKHRPDTVELPSPSPRLISAGDGRPMLSRATVPP